MTLGNSNLNRGLRLILHSEKLPSLPRLNKDITKCKKVQYIIKNCVAGIEKWGQKQRLGHHKSSSTILQTMKKQCSRHCSAEKKL